MATKLQKMRQVIKQYGSEYGWEWAQKTGLLYAPSQHGLDYYDSWNLQQDIANGNENAKRVAQAVEYLGRYELREAQRTLRRRGSAKSNINELYRQSAIDVLQQQRDRVSKAADLSSSILNLQNIYRESTESAMRQTPRVRASAKGVQARVERSRQTLEKALTSDAIWAKTSNVDSESYETLRVALARLGVNLNDIADAYKQQVGDPYRALELAYIEGQERAAERIEQIKNSDDYEEFLNSDEAVNLLRMLGVDFT